MEIRDHRFPGLWHALSPNHGGPLLNPRFVVMHYTAGWSGAGARDYLSNPDAPYTPSAHLVIDRSGEAWQIVPFNVKAWHAGRSAYGGVRGLNHHSIGIELDNIGWLRPDERRQVALDPYGQACQIDEIDGEWWIRTRGTRSQPVGEPYCRTAEVFAGRHPKGGPHLWWPTFTEPQLATLEALTKAILVAYPSIREIIGHEDCKADKTDPGPAFPMARFKRLVNDRSDSGEDWRVVTASALNVRGGPGVEFDRLVQAGPLPRGTLVEVLDSVDNWVFARFKARSNVHEGWLYDWYLAPADPPDTAAAAAAATA